MISVREAATWSGAWVATGETGPFAVCDDEGRPLDPDGEPLAVHGSRS